MDVDESKIGDWPNVALLPGTHTHAATGEHVEQPENTRIGRSRGACRPDNADCEHEPANVENRPQDGLECDTREQLEADICECINARSWGMNHDYIISCLVDWLDRQAAISEREVENDLMVAGRMAVEVERERIKELTAERDKLVQDKLIDLAGMSCPECVDTRINELTTERDELREKNRRQRKQLGELQNAIHERNNGVLKRQWQQQIEELRDKMEAEHSLRLHWKAQVEELERVNKRQARKLTGVCSLNDVQSRRIKELTAERDELKAEVEAQRKRANDAERGVLSEEWYVSRDRHEDDMAEMKAERDDLRSRLKAQADSFQKLERDNAQLRDKLERVREMAGGDA